MIANLVLSNHDSWCGDTNIYHVNPPYQGFDHVAVSVHNVQFGQWQNAGTEIVGCREDGCIEADTVDALYQTYEVLTFPEALARIGYQEEES